MATKSRKRRKTDSQKHNVTAGSTIRMEAAQSDRKPKPNTARVVVQEINPVGGFINFLKEYTVVGLAIGFVIGTQAQVLVKQLVASFIDPLFKLLVGGQLLSQRYAVLHFRDRSAVFGWGAFAYSLLSFVFVLAAIYLIVKLLRLDKLKKIEVEEED